MTSAQPGLQFTRRNDDRPREAAPMPLSRSDFQRLADVRIAEAKVLLDAGMWDGAYYLAGYAVECALKALSRS